MPIIFLPISVFSNDIGIFNPVFKRKKQRERNGFSKIGKSNRIKFSGS